MEALKIKISKDFSPSPGPRYIDEGDYSGELFRKDYLSPIVIKAIENNQSLVVDLDGTAGYGTSFLEESFGGLIREEKLDFETLKRLIQFISNEEPYLIDDIIEYMNDAQKELDQK